MLKNRKMSNKNLLGITLLGIILMGSISTSVSANPTYQLALTKGTEFFEITKYDNDGWENTVGNITMPEDWFEGDSNKTGAQGKFTVKRWIYLNTSTYNMFLELMFSYEQFIAFMALSELGYNETEINNNYTNSYWLWYGLGAEWHFTDLELNETADDSNSKIIILYHPEDYKKFLDDYNDLVETIKNDPDVPLSIKFQFSNITADELLWKLIFDGLAAASPFNDYLNALINELNVENATVNQNTIVIERYGVTNYTVEVSYGSKGTLSTFIVKDVNDQIIYQITSYNTEWIFFTILITIGISFAGIVSYLLFRKFKLNKSRKM